MNTNDKFVITINRQFGTGGHEVGAELARRLNVKILDRQILKAVADRFDADEAATEKLNARNISWRDDFSRFYQQYVAEHEYKGSDSNSTSRELFREQAEVSRASSSEDAPSTSSRIIPTHSRYSSIVPWRLASDASWRNTGLQTMMPN